MLSMECTAVSLPTMVYDASLSDLSGIPGMYAPHCVPLLACDVQQCIYWGQHLLHPPFIALASTPVSNGLDFSKLNWEKNDRMHAHTHWITLRPRRERPAWFVRVRYRVCSDMSYRYMCTGRVPGAGDRCYVSLPSTSRSSSCSTSTSTSSRWVLIAGSRYPTLYLRNYNNTGCVDGRANKFEVLHPKDVRILSTVQYLLGSPWFMASPVHVRVLLVPTVGTYLPYTCISHISEIPRYLGYRVRVPTYRSM